MLKFKAKETKPIRTLIYGLDGTGKSTAAKKYCQKKGLKPVVIDMDNTNWTELPILDVKFQGPKMFVTAVNNIIMDISKSPDFDTLIIDGIGSMVDLFIPDDGKGQYVWTTRNQHFNRLWKCLVRTPINIIFIGQDDMVVKPDKDTNKIAVKINAMVNWKFECTKKGNNFYNECTKWRGEKEEPI